MQVGGLGYMTVGSLAVFGLRHRLSGARARTVRANFGLPGDIDLPAFLRSVALYTPACEAAGALALWILFRAENVPEAGWSAVFHAVSAFGTAGFSLLATSFEAFRGHAGVNIALSILAILGAMGFLFVLEIAETLTGRARELGLSSRTILRFTWILLAGGTAFLPVAEQTISALPQDERVPAAFFQAMTATTAMGFNTCRSGSLPPHPCSSSSS